MEKNRVAISQPFVILGGRLQVILGIVKALNSLGIEPDILTLGTSFDPQEVKSNYGQNLRLNFHQVLRFFPWKFLPQDYQILVFNFMLKFLRKDYELLIDSGNSQIFLPKKKNILSYIHFPRESRIFKSSGKIERPVSIRSIFNFLSTRFLRFVYRVADKNIDHAFICNSQFTQQALQDCFPDLKPESIQVIYPPVDISSYTPKQSLTRQKSVISLGRFSPDKKQLGQLKIAQLLPDLDFHLVGFVNNASYFTRCEEFISANQLRNVTLHPNTSHAQVVELLARSKYFLHILEDEPFGITAVEAIAAGCIPLVHDSGGQRETVPLAELRYKQLSDIPKLISEIEQKDDQEIARIRKLLITNAKRNFDEGVFMEKISLVLRDFLPNP
jgi:glycosyltransferase involved in cell wall biosynthesis